MQSLHATQPAHSAARPRAWKAAAGRWHARSTVVRSAASTTTDAAYTTLVRSVVDMVQEAAQSSARAAADGKKRQTVQFLNPINEKALNFMAVDAMDYPCSNMKEFETICTVTKSFLQALLGDDVELQLKRIDEGGIDGDLCAIINANGKQAVAVVWPTAEKLKTLKQLAEDKSIGQLFIINPQWRLEGNLVSEFGIGPWRKANEDFVATFEPVYSLKEQRIGAPSSINMSSGTRYATGGVVRMQRCYPGQHVAFAMAANGASQAIAQVDKPPTYKELEALLNKGRQAGLEIFKVAVAASALELENGRSSSGSSSSSSSGGSSDSEELQEGQVFYSEEQIRAMEPARLKRVLISLGLPSAGTLQKLQLRALAVSAAVYGEGASLEAAVEAARKLK